MRVRSECLVLLHQTARGGAVPHESRHSTHSPSTAPFCSWRDPHTRVLCGHLLGASSADYGSPLPDAEARELAEVCRALTLACRLVDARDFCAAGERGQTSRRVCQLGKGREALFVEIVVVGQVDEDLAAARVCERGTRRARR